MAEFEQALQSRLTSYSGLSALVGTRVYPVIAPQGATRPFVTYQRISGDRMDGMTQAHGIAEPVIQIDCWGNTYTSVKAVAAQVRAALLRTAWTEDSVDTLDAFLESEIDGYEEGISDAAAKLYRVSLNVRFQHREKRGVP